MCFFLFLIIFCNDVLAKTADATESADESEICRSHEVEAVHWEYELIL